MTAEQLIQELFVNHWFAMTIFVPWLTFIYAWITDQTTWWVCSFILALVYKAT